jgi:hypothetical protein
MNVKCLILSIVCYSIRIRVYLMNCETSVGENTSERSQQLWPHYFRTNDDL